ncbi:MAG: hypothetical protein U0350_11130 [Caldilineaceae bacterium]
MPTTSHGPQLQKGALITINLQNGAQKAIIFQYNPEKLTRTIKPGQVEPSGAERQRAMALRYKGAPEETIDLDIAIDATDQLEAGNATAGSSGIYPQLAALETLLYPFTFQITDVDALAKQGCTEVASGYEAPFTLFVWGQQRVLPVLITGFTITEEIFDANLNPVQATVKLGLRALSYSDLNPQHKGYKLFLTYQKKKEELAASALLSALPDVQIALDDKTNQLVMTDNRKPAGTSTK